MTAERWRSATRRAAGILVLFFAAHAATGSEAAATPPGWQLVWQDEFDGTVINPAHWTRETGGHGWGNRELQAYTTAERNAAIEDGHLVIRAREESVGDNRYSSARLTTMGKKEFQYGRVEARIQLPRGTGLWPAFWMLGADFPADGWPQCGEIDIMENIGSEPEQVHGTVHAPGYSGRNGVGASHQLASGADFADNFHVFAVEWQEDEIRWFVDGQMFSRLTPADVPAAWAFNRPFFLMLNLAVGGKWPGSPDDTTRFPQAMTIDYVRVYQRSGVGSTEP